MSVPVSPTATVEDVIRVRGSQRRMHPGTGLSLEVLRTCMTVACAACGCRTGSRSTRSPASPRASASGLTPALELREEVSRVCLDQPQARDAAFVAIAVTRVNRLSDRQYREALLAAGLAEGRVPLAGQGDQGGAYAGDAAAALCQGRLVHAFLVAPYEILTTCGNSVSWFPLM